VALGARTVALYDSDAMNVSCLDCGATRAAVVAEPAAQVLTVDRGVPGAGPQREYMRRRAKRETQIEERWGRLASIVKLMSDDPPSTTAWRKGAEGERLLAAHLEHSLGDSAVTLHSRRVPHSKADIDHLVIAPSGVWIVDTKNYQGRVEHRVLGSRRTPEHRLYVNGRDHTELVTGMDRQVHAVRTALAPLGLMVAPVHPALLFIDSDWGLFGKPFEIHGVKVLWAKRLSQAIAEPGPWDADTVQAVARQLSAALPPKS
jgi:hypothetical protein